MAEEYGWLQEVHPIYALHSEAWDLNEHRLDGLAAVLKMGDLSQWKGEEDPHYKQRRSRATYLNLPAIHASILIGHLRANAPQPGTGAMSFGAMGEVRERESIDDLTLAEQLWYEANGRGTNTQGWEEYTDGVLMRAMATGVRWCMVEMPAPFPWMRADADGRVNYSTRDRLDGYRPFFRDFSPLEVPLWENTEGVLDFAVARIPIGQTRVVEGRLLRPGAEPGYYLLVREGYDALGPEFVEGGWWRFTAQREPYMDEGPMGFHMRWGNTNGMIPLFAMVIGGGYGATNFPTLGRSLTAELGAIAAALMNLDSARDFDALDAAKSTKWMLGGDPTMHNLAQAMLEKGSIFITIPPYYPKDADGNLIPGAPPMTPTIYDSSAGAVPAEVFTTILESKLKQARELMVRQTTSGLEISGLSREAAFAEGTSPLLSTLATAREGPENNLLYFAALRAGLSPRGVFVRWPDRFLLSPILDMIDQSMVQTLVQLDLRPPTLIKEIVRAKASALRLTKSDTMEKQIEAEVEAELEGRQVERTQTRQMGDEIDQILTGAAAAPPANGMPTPSGAALSGAGA